MKALSKRTGNIIDVNEQILAQNPDLFTPIQEPTQQAPAPQQDFMSRAIGFGKNAISDMISPFVRTGQNIAGAEFEVKRALENKIGNSPLADIPLLGHLFARGRNAYVDQNTGVVRENPYLSQERLQGITNDPLAEGARNGAGMLSYAIPYGKGANIFTKAVAPGFAQGAMFAASKEGATTGDVVGGGIGGGLFGAGTYGLSKILGGLGNTGQGLRKQVLNPQIEATPYYSSQVDKAQKLASDIGLHGGADRQLFQLNKEWDSVQQGISGILKNSKTQALQKTAQSNFENALENSNYLESMPGYKEAKSSLLKRLSGIFDHGSASAESIYGLKSQLRQELTNTFTKPALTPKEEVKQALFESLKTTLDDLVPEVRGLNQHEAELFNLSKGLVKQAETKFRLPLIGAHVSEAPFQEAGDAIGRGMINAAKPAGFIGAVGRNPIPIPASQSILRELTRPSDTAKPTSQAMPGMENSITTQSGLNNLGVNKKMGGLNLTLDQMTQIMLSPKISDKTKERFQYLYKEQQSQAGGGKKMSAAAAKDLSRNMTAMRDIATLEQELKNNPFVVTQAAIPGSPGARSYRAVQGGILDAIGTNRTGAAYTSEQRKDYEHLLPVPGDSPETIQFKLQRIKQEIGTYVQNLGSSSMNDAMIAQ